LLYYPLLLFSLSCHEAAHAWVANRFGDPTARYLGRISLNPLRHIDPIGTFLLPVISMLSGIPLIGWAKPVPVNPYNLENPRRDTLWISAAGPGSNFLLACGFALIAWAIVLGIPALGVTAARGSVTATAVIAALTLSKLGVMSNLALAFFNLIPMHPLDGGGIIRGILPLDMVQAFDRLARYGFVILLILVLTRAINVIFVPVDILAGKMLP
jgi:Zn-dependent protease